VALLSGEPRLQRISRKRLIHMKKHKESMISNHRSVSMASHSLITLISVLLKAEEHSGALSQSLENDILKYCKYHAW
jgi:hypothetical protein